MSSAFFEVLSWQKLFWEGLPVRTIYIVKSHLLFYYLSSYGRAVLARVSLLFESVDQGERSESRSRVVEVLHRPRKLGGRPLLLRWRYTLQPPPLPPTNRGCCCLGGWWQLLPCCVCVYSYNDESMQLAKSESVDPKIDPSAASQGMESSLENLNSILALHANQ